jgi:O-antigen/teichoic acid export membrane protein
MGRRIIRRSRTQGGFASRIGFNGLAQLAPILASLAITPLLIERLGADRFGIWSLALIVLSTLVSLDAGVSASLARYFAAHAARGERAAAGRMLTGSFLFFVGFGVVATVVAYVLAPTLVMLVHIPPDLVAEAVWAFRWLPALATLALFTNASAALLQGNGQFRQLATATAVSSAVFVIAVLLLVNPGADLPEMFAAAPFAT